MTITKQKKKFICDHSGKVIELTRIPTGWKWFGDRLLSGQAVKSLYALRAISIPIRWSDDEEWNKNVNGILKQGFSYATALANWFITEMYIRDVKRTPDLEKLPGFSVSSLYQDAKLKFPLDVVPSGLLASVEHRVRGSYCKRRFGVLWTGRDSLASHRYPAPYPIRSQDWKLIKDDDGNMSIQANIMRERLVLPLSHSYKYKRQRDGLLHVLESGGKFGELIVNQNNKGKVFCRISAYFPREIHPTRSGTLFVRSDSDSLIIALNAKDQRLWIYHADQARRWVHEHRRKLNRWADDTKYEDRPRPGFADRRTAAVKKFRNRMDSLTHQIAERIVRYASRRKFAEIELDLTDKSFVDRFPWHELERKVLEKSALRNIEVKVIGK